MIRKILKMGDPLLLRQAKPVDTFGTKELDDLIQDMFDTMKDSGGVGLAAPQIGVEQQIIVFGFEKSDRYPGQLPVPMTVLINPKITVLSNATQEGWEGCLSVPGLMGLVTRSSKISYQGYDAQGQAFEHIAEGFHARIVQHEYDHLIGRLYPGRITDLTKFGFLDSLPISKNREQDLKEAREKAEAANAVV